MLLLALPMFRSTVVTVAEVLEAVNDSKAEGGLAAFLMQFPKIFKLGDNSCGNVSIKLLKDPDARAESVQSEALQKTGETTEISEILCTDSPYLVSDEELTSQHALLANTTSKSADSTSQSSTVFDNENSVSQNSNSNEVSGDAIFPQQTNSKRQVLFTTGNMTIGNDSTKFSSNKAYHSNDAASSSKKNTGPQNSTNFDQGKKQSNGENKTSSNYKTTSSSNLNDRVRHHWKYDSIIMAKESHIVAPKFSWRHGIIEYVTTNSDGTDEIQRSYGTIRCNDTGGVGCVSAGYGGPENTFYFDKRSVTGNARLIPAVNDRVRLLPWRSGRRNPISGVNIGRDKSAAKKVEILEYDMSVVSFRGLRHLFRELRVFSDWKWLLNGLLESVSPDKDNVNHNFMSSANEKKSSDNNISTDLIKRQHSSKADDDDNWRESSKDKKRKWAWLSDESSEDEGTAAFISKKDGKKMSSSTTNERREKNSDEKPEKSTKDEWSDSDEDSASDFWFSSSDDEDSSSDAEGTNAKVSLRGTTNTDGLPLRKHLKPLQLKRRRSLSETHESFWVLCVRELLLYVFPVQSCRGLASAIISAGNKSGRSNITSWQNAQGICVSIEKIIPMTSGAESNNATSSTPSLHMFTNSEICSKVLFFFASSSFICSSRKTIAFRADTSFVRRIGSVIH